MSITYTPQTNFTAKDSMATSNPDKVLSGVPFDAEFTAISNAFQLAATTNNPSFTGTTTTDILVATTVNGTATSVWDAAAATVTADAAGWDATEATVTANAATWNSTASTVSSGATNWNTAFGWGDHSTEGYLVASASDKSTWDATATTVSNNQTNWTAAYNDKVNSMGFNNGNGVLTLTQQDGGTLTVDLDGRYSVTDTNTTYTAGAGLDLSAGDEFSHADTSSQSSVANTGNFVVQSISVDDFGHVTSLSSKEITGATAYTASSGVQLVGADFRHADTSAQSSSNNSGQVFIQDITLDDFGHITAIGTGTATDTNTTYSAGSGLSLVGTTFSHADTSSQASVNNSGNTFIQDITLDGNGHITGLAMGTASDTNTTYSAGTGLNLAGTTFSVTGDIRNNVTHIGLDSTDYVTFTNNQKVSLVVASTERVAATTAGCSVTGALTASGDVTAYSDARLKSNVETLDGSKVLEMRGVSYHKDGKLSSGVIAQELQEVAPELVNDDGEYLSVAYGNLVGYLIEAVKTLDARVKELEG